MNANLNRLEEALMEWEKKCFLESRAEQINSGLKGARCELNNVLKHFGDFRKFLLSRNKVFRPEMFLPDEEAKVRNIPHGGWYLLPKELHAWCINSRRIYRLTEDIQQFFAVTSIGRLTWTDITLPFDSFGIALAVPIQVSDTRGDGQSTFNCYFDFILVNRRPSPYGHLIIELSLIGINRNFRPLARKWKRRIDDAISERKFKKARQLLSDIHERLTLSSECHIRQCQLEITKEMTNTLVVDIFRNIKDIKYKSLELEEKARSEILAMVRTLVGLCLYLESLGSTGSSKKHLLAINAWQKCSVPNTDPGTVLSEAEVCTVTYESILSPEDKRFFSLIQQKGLSQALKEMGTHFRCAHWRRPPGKGSDSSAPKTVHVKSTIVRPDRLPPDQGLPPSSGFTVS